MRGMVLGSMLASAFASVLVLGVGARTAHACSCSIEPGPTRTPASPWFSATEFPTNALFTSSLEWRDASGAPLPLVRDAELSAALGYEVRRPAEDVAPGAVFAPTDDCPATGTCRHALVFGGGPDTTPPSAAELVDVRVMFADDAPETGTSCQVDSLVLEVAGTDDTTPRDELVTVVFVGATEADAASVEAFSMGFAYDGGPPSRRLVSTIVLGGAEGHRRDGGPLRASGPFCFAAALMDWAGNVGPRSAVRCLDTTDESDAAVQLVAYDPPCSGPFCAIAPGSRPAPAALVLVAMLGMLAHAARRARRG
ncbi:MAG: hypothetical protein M3Y87_36150 [Myxococcota bacterium]|nr:hypothetical protein [Myxococcota bacterium]